MKGKGIGYMVQFGHGCSVHGFFEKSNHPGQSLNLSSGIIAQPGSVGQARQETRPI